MRSAPEELSETVALERLYQEQGDRMWRAVLGFTGDPEVASDAVAEAFAQALRRAGAIRNPERWVWCVVFRLAAGEMKERAQRGASAREESYEMEEPARGLVEALARIPEKQRRALVLHHAAGYPVKEVAATIGSTSAAVRMSLTRGRRRLRELLREVDGA